MTSHGLHHVFALLVALALSRSLSAQVCPTFSPRQSGGTIQSSLITEASGLAASRQHAGVLWIHNDSGDTNRVFAIGTNGALLGTFILAGANAVDWEDIAVGQGPIQGVNYLYVGDTGDNSNARANIVIYRVPEPASLTSQTLNSVDAITLVYPDGPRDAETVMVDVNGDIYIVSKRVTAKGRVYRAAFPQSTTQTNFLQYVGEMPWGAVSGTGGATGGDISADGSAIIVRRLSLFSPAATLWRRAPGTNLWDVFTQPGCNVAMPSQLQGESIAFAANSLSLYTVGEGSNQPVYFMPRIIRPGDVDGDDLVNVNDLLAVINGWGPCPAKGACLGDVSPPGDGDNVVNVNDLLAVINNWD